MTHFTEKAEEDLRKSFPNGMRAFGSDALRFALLRHDLTAEAVSIDIARLAEEGWRFCNKLWNMAYYCEKVFLVTEMEDQWDQEAQKSLTNNNVWPFYTVVFKWIL